MIDFASYEISDGYIGSLGVTYKTATEDTLFDAIERAAARHGMTEADIYAVLVSGTRVAWCTSPNYTYDHGLGYIRRKQSAPTIKLTKCDCGHSVPDAQVMIASMGTACPYCYDKMSN